MPSDSNESVLTSMMVASISISACDTSSCRISAWYWPMRSGTPRTMMAFEPSSAWKNGVSSRAVSMPASGTSSRPAGSRTPSLRVDPLWASPARAPYDSSWARRLFGLPATPLSAPTGMSVSLAPPAARAPRLKRLFSVVARPGTRVLPVTRSAATTFVNLKTRIDVPTRSRAPPSSVSITVCTSSMWRGGP